MPAKRHYYSVYPWMVVLASVLACLWLVSTIRSYNEGVSADDYDEYGVLDAYGVSLMVAEQAESLSWIERWIAGADEKAPLQKDAIRTLEHARRKGQLEEAGLVTLACLYWTTGDKTSCRAVVAELPSQEYVSTKVLVDLLDGKRLDDEQWKNFESEIQDWPREWTICFLAEKALDTQADQYEGSEKLAELVDQRKQGFLIASAQLSIVSWVILLAGLICLASIVRNRKTLYPGGVGSGFGRISRLPRLWPLSLAVIVFVTSDFVADGMTGLMWMSTPDYLLTHAMNVVAVLIDSYWRLFGALVMLLVFFLRPDFAKRTLLKPVTKLMHWVLAACSVTWLFDIALYQLPDDWFPFDSTIGHHWPEMGWGGLIAGLISAVLLAPICEEMIFRGLLYNAIKNRLGVHAGIWISAVIFSSVHFYGIQNLIAVGFFGVVMGYLYRLTNSLVPCILCHALFNLVVTIWNWILYQSPEEIWKIG